MNIRRVAYVAIAFVLIMQLSLSHSILLATRCQVRHLTYSIPPQAPPAQRIETATTVVGSCYSNGEDYYSIRVDLVDVPSSSIWSSNSTPIGYNATSFNVTVENMVTTPSNNGTWHIDVDVYVIRAGGTSGAYLLDYRGASNATIAIGTPTPIPEFPTATIIALTISLCAALATTRRKKQEHS